jgi:hypothetical protein
VDPLLRRLAVVRRGGPGLLLEAGNPGAGQAALAIAGGGGPAPARACPAARSPGGGAPAAGPGVLYAACQRVLRPGGVLAVITASTPCPGGLRDDPGEAITQARAAGLIYAQHIVALHGPICGSQLAPGPEDTSPGTWSPTRCAVSAPPWSRPSTSAATPSAWSTSPGGRASPPRTSPTPAGRARPGRRR